MSTRDTSTPSDDAPDPRRWQALALVCVAFFMTVVDLTIVNVALPSIQRSLHLATPSLNWVISFYALAKAAIREYIQRHR